jgi:phosphatidate cytidylyltransferase
MNETVKRILSGMTLAAMAIAVIYWYDFFYWVLPLLFIIVFSQTALIEFYRLSDRGASGRPMFLTGMLFSLLITLGYYAGLLKHDFLSEEYSPPSGFFIDALNFLYPSDSGILFIIVLFILSAMAYQMMFRPLHGAIYSAGVTVIGVMYTSLTLSHTLLYFQITDGIFFLLFIITGTLFTDIGAYFAGKFLGTHNAGLTVSPNKTYEGFAGGFIASLISMWGVQRLAVNYQFIEEFYFDFTDLIIVTVFIAALTVIGDLVESMIKRDAEKKDSASLIPGHGGMLDLIDALLFTLPLGYYYIIIRFGNAVL